MKITKLTPHRVMFKARLSPEEVREALEAYLREKVGDPDLTLITAWGINSMEAVNLLREGNDSLEVEW